MNKKLGLFIIFSSMPIFIIGDIIKETDRAISKEFKYAIPGRKKVITVKYFFSCSKRDSYRKEKWEKIQEAFNKNLTSYFKDSHDTVVRPEIYLKIKRDAILPYHITYHLMKKFPETNTYKIKKDYIRDMIWVTRKKDNKLFVIYDEKNCLNTAEAIIKEVKEYCNGVRNENAYSDD